MAAITNADAIKMTESSRGVIPESSASGDHPPVSAKGKEDSSTTATGKTATGSEPDDNNAGEFPINSGPDLGAPPPKKPTKKAAKKASTSTEADASSKSKKPVKKTEDKVSDRKESELLDLDPQTQPLEIPSAPTVPHPNDLPSIFDAPTLSSAHSAPAAQAPITSSTRDFVRSGSKGFTSPLKKATAKTAAVDMTTSTVLPQPDIPPTPAAPLKRAPEGTLTPPPDLKRIKTDIAPPLTPEHLKRPLTTSPSPRPQSIEAQVAEQRKRLETTRKKRAEMAKKRAALDEKMAPYKKQMAEELERLRQENAEEEAMMAEDEQDYQAREMMLEEYMRVNGGDF